MIATYSTILSLIGANDIDHGMEDYVANGKARRATLCRYRFLTIVLPLHVLGDLLPFYPLTRGPVFGVQHNLLLTENVEL